MNAFDLLYESEESELESLTVGVFSVCIILRSKLKNVFVVWDILSNTRLYYRVKPTTLLKLQIAIDRRDLHFNITTGLICSSLQTILWELLLFIIPKH